MTYPRVVALLLTRSQRQRMYTIRNNSFPNESCALLLGTFRDGGSTAVVLRIEEMENISRSPSKFAIDPEQQYRVLETAAQDNLDQVGIFHSHPAPPKPSHWDLEYMEYNPCVWVIDGIQGKRHRMKAFQLINGQLYSVRILTIN